MEKFQAKCVVLIELVCVWIPTSVNYEVDAAGCFDAHIVKMLMFVMLYSQTVMSAIGYVFVVTGSQR